MQVFTDPGRPSADDKGRTASELRVELDSYGDGTTGVVVYVNQYRGNLLVTVQHGDPEWRPAVDNRTRKRPAADILVVNGLPMGQP